jgi:DNA-binding XRE family transcriptional regulator
MEINKIREAVAALPRASNGKFLRIPDELRAEITFGAKQFDGRLEEFAQAIGISYTTILGWEKRRGAKLFRKIKLKTEIEQRCFTVEGPKGLKVPGLRLCDIARLFSEVSL